jgi:hypothetical protein
MGRFSRLAIACIALGAVAFLIADFKFSSGILSVPTSASYVSAIFSPLHDQPRVAGFWPSDSITEAQLIIGLSLLSLAAASTAVALGLVARRRLEPPVAYSGALALSFALSVLSFRLLSWVWPVHVSLAT